MYGIVVIVENIKFVLEMLYEDVGYLLDVSGSVMMSFYCIYGCGMCFEL